MEKELRFMAPYITEEGGNLHAWGVSDSTTLPVEYWDKLTHSIYPELHLHRINGTTTIYHFKRKGNSKASKKS